MHNDGEDDPKPANASLLLVSGRAWGVSVPFVGHLVVVPLVSNVPPAAGEDDDSVLINPLLEVVFAQMLAAGFESARGVLATAVESARSADRVRLSAAGAHLAVSARDLVVLQAPAQLASAANAIGQVFDEELCVSGYAFDLA